MNDLKILQELELPLFVPRVQEETPQQEQGPSLPLAVFVSESSAEFSEAHQSQLDKILAFLNFSKEKYTLIFNNQGFNNLCDTLLCFGKPPQPVPAANIVVTHSISAMLRNPACKREVLHAIQHLKLD